MDGLMGGANKGKWAKLRSIDSSKKRILERVVEAQQCAQTKTGICVWVFILFFWFSDPYSACDSIVHFLKHFTFSSHVNDNINNNAATRQAFKEYNLLV